MIEAADRPLAPLGRRAATAQAVREVGPYVWLDLLDQSKMAPRAGQFYMLSTASGWGGGSDGRPYLPRALSFARACESDGGRVLTFMLEAVGPGTERIARTAVGEELLISGPFGNGFSASEAPALLVGGGIGVAPLLALSDELRVEGAAPAAVLLGFRNAEYALAADLFDGAAEVATDDGSTGHHGLVTNLLADRLAGANANVFSCGPPAMLAAVHKLCVAADTPVQLALESGMACGYGACYGCVVETKSGYVRLCVDGPVLDGSDFEIGAVPSH